MCVYVFWSDKGKTNCLNLIDMLLIDALYINNSGGLELLKYLVDSLEKINHKVFYLFDNRCSSVFGAIDNHRCLFLKASVFNRLLFYQQNCVCYDKILCFGNIPPPIEMTACVYTYFHNINLLKIPNGISLMTRVICFLKQKFIKCNRKYTDYWIVQTSNTKNEIRRVFHVPINEIIICPFFEIEEKDESDIHGVDYTYIANYTPSKQHLILVKAWKKLYQLGYNLTLHLTLSNCPQELDDEIAKSINGNIKIINHGFIDRDAVLDLYKRSKAIVYPSVNESFGLGIIEALSYGCDVIGPDLPYIHSVCVPSSTFASFSVDDLVSAIINYEDSHCVSSKLIISNKINELIKMLS